MSIRHERPGAEASRAEVRAFDGGFGAELVGIDLREPTDDAVDVLRNAVLEHGVVFARDQQLSDEQHLALAARFGSLSVYPVLRLAGVDRPLEFIEDTAEDPPKAERWHSDLTWLDAPPKFAFLAMLVAPSEGGDTMWSDTQVAYEALDPAAREAVVGRRGHHRVEPESFERFESKFGGEVASRFRDEYGAVVSHPLVRRNPDTGRDALFLGGYWMSGIAGLPEPESAEMLRRLHEHATQPRFTLRWRWRENDLAVWDERRTMHRALGDHWPRHRKVRRCTVDGEVPS